MPTIPAKTITQERFDQLKEMTGLAGQELLDWFWIKTKEKMAAEWRLHDKGKFKRGETVTHVELDLDN